jgi:hypothetical protein
MICTGMPAVPISMQQWLEFYNSVYRLNYDLYRIWWGPALDIYLGAVSEYQNSTNAD